MKTAKMKEEQKQQETIAVPEITDKIEKLDIQSEDPSAAERSDQKSQEEEIEDIAKNKRKTEPAETTTPLLAPANEEEEEEPITLPNIISQCNKDEYLVKTIDWQDKKVRIITQNENGPCPLVAICNVLFLRGDLDIQPPDREVVTFEYIVDRLGDYLLTHAPTDEVQQQQETISSSPTTTTTTQPQLHRLENRQATSEFVLTYRHNLDTALSILPNLKSGLDVNVKFDNIHGFEPTAELAMFDLFHVDLIHGWIADPQDIETYDVVVKKCGTYNHTVECIVQADELSTSQTAPKNETAPPVKYLTIAEEEKLHQGFIATEFLNNTATQLTYYGLDLLLDSIPVDTLCVLFRNNHFSTVYRHANSGLFMLVTDSGLVLERSIIWESLSDVDQGSSEFYNGQFIKPKITESSSQAAVAPITGDEQEDLDYAIAVSIQDEQKRQQRNSWYHGSNGSSGAAAGAVSGNKTKKSSTAKPITTSKKSDNSTKCVIS